MGKFPSPPGGSLLTISLSITPWLTNLGYQNCFISAAFVGMTASSVFFVMIKYGKHFRVKSAAKYLALVKSDEAQWRTS